jgi:hypothetical protein
MELKSLSVKLHVRISFATVCTQMTFCFDSNDSVLARATVTWTICLRKLTKSFPCNNMAHSCLLPRMFWAARSEVSPHLLQGRREGPRILVLYLLSYGNIKVRFMEPAGPVGGVRTLKYRIKVATETAIPKVAQCLCSLGIGPIIGSSKEIYRWVWLQCVPLLCSVPQQDSKDATSSVV